MTQDPTLLAGVAVVLLAVVILLFVAFRPRFQDIHISRRQPFTAEARDSAVARLNGVTAAYMERHLGKKSKGAFGADALSAAGLKLTPSEFMLWVALSTVVAAIVGLLVQGILLALALVVLVPVGAHVFITVKTGRRRVAFEDQLSDMLMSLSGSLRAGHSISQSMHSCSVEMPAPMSEELARIVNEVRVGRSAPESMAEVGRKMQCEDFEWLSQAIEINREVGGDLAGVLDHVAETVRERAQIKGQVRALAAEGKFSAYILIGLPFFVAAFVNMTNPGYMSALTGSVLGWTMIGAGLVMMAIGSFWISRMVKIKF